MMRLCRSGKEPVRGRNPYDFHHSVHKGAMMMNKKNLLAISFSVMLPSLMLPGLASAADTCESLTITGHPSYAPVAWSAQGQIVGAAADLVTAVARKLGVK